MFNGGGYRGLVKCWFILLEKVVNELVLWDEWEIFRLRSERRVFKVEGIVFVKV